MTLSTRRLALAFLVMVTALVFAPATASAGVACQDAGIGVTVVVDFRGAGGAIEVGCAPGAPSSGFAALQAAGFAITELQGLSGFLCKIDGYPADEDCASTPPGDAFWSYWSAERGGSWSYSIVGGATRVPAPGTVDGWSFGAATAPGMSPPPEPPATPTTTTTVAPTTTTTTTALASTTTTAVAATATTTSMARETATTSTHAPVTSVAAVTTSTLQPTTTTAAPVTAATAGALETTTTTAAASGPVPDEGDGGGGSGAIAALGALVGIGIAGATVVARRRRLGA